MEAMILAGGLGTRLRTVLGDTPKVMARVAGRPFVEWVLLELRRQGITRAILCTGHLGYVVENHFRHGEDLGMDIVYSREESPLGTGGAIKRGMECIRGDRFLVVNGDSFCRVDISQMEASHLNSRASATLWLAPSDNRGRFASVSIAEDGSVVAFREKSTEAGTGFVSVGVYLLERATAERIPPFQKVSIETDLFPSLVNSGLYAVVGNDGFLDIGTPEAFAGAEAFLEANRVI